MTLKLTPVLTLSLLAFFASSAFAGYDCEVTLAKTAKPSIVLGTLLVSQPTGSDSSANWGRLHVEKKSKLGVTPTTETVIELGGWVDATARNEGAKFSVYRNSYAGGERVREEFLRPIQMDGTYDRTTEFEAYTIRVNCGVK